MKLNNLSHLTLLFCISFAVLFVTACGEDDEGNGNPQMEEFKTSGFVVASALPATGAFTAYTKFSAELPSGEIDLTEGESAPTQFYAGNCGSFFYGRPRETGFFGIAKFAIDAETEQIMEVERINTADPQFRIIIVNETLGFSSGFGTLEVIAFNPTDMSIIQRIDLSENTPLPEGGEGITRGVSGMYYNNITNKLILALNYDLAATPVFYDLTDGYIEVIDVATLSREGSSIQPGAMYLRMNGNENTVLDAQGNLYIVAQGSYGLDGLAGPLAPDFAKPRILKVDATTSQFDTDYPWNPVVSAGFGANFIHVFSAMIGTGTNRGYGFISAAPDPPRLLELLALFAAGQLDEAGQVELRDLVFESENGQLVELDFSARSATLVDGAPLTAAFNYPYLYNYDGLIYSQVASSTYNGFYVTDPNNGNETRPLFNITAGGFATDLIRLSSSCN